MAVYLPQVILVIMLIVSIVAAFSLMAVGALLLLQPPPSSVLRYQYLFDYPHIIFIAVIVFALTLMANFTPIPRLMVRVMYWLDHFRFTHGWANANWQLHHYKAFFALGVEDVEIERLANGAIAEIIASGRASQEAQTPQPAGLSRSELANYLLIGCTMEGLSRLYPKDRQRPLAA